MTDLQQAKNKMLFGKAELTDDFTGEGMGMVGQAGSDAQHCSRRGIQGRGGGRGSESRYAHSYLRTFTST